MTYFVLHLNSFCLFAPRILLLRELAISRHLSSLLWAHVAKGNDADCKSQAKTFRLCWNPSLITNKIQQNAIKRRTWNANVLISRSRDRYLVPVLPRPSKWAMVYLLIGFFGRQRQGQKWPRLLKGSVNKLVNRAIELYSCVANFKGRVTAVQRLRPNTLEQDRNGGKTAPYSFRPDTKLTSLFPQINCTHRLTNNTVNSTPLLRQ